MSEQEETVTIPVHSYDRLLRRDWWLAFLEGAGVDNWSGFDYAVEAWKATHGANTPLPE